MANGDTIEIKNLSSNESAQMAHELKIVYDALQEKGYNAVDQIVGYLLSEDPTYITTYNNARSIIRRLDRDEILRNLVKSYVNK